MSLTSGPISREQLDERVAGQTVARLFLATVERHADAVALRWKDGDEYRCSRGRSTRTARPGWPPRSAELGVGRGTRVAMLLGNRPEFHIADIAVLLVGGTPISIYNSSSEDQIRYLVHHSRAQVVIVEDGRRTSIVSLAVRADLPRSRPRRDHRRSRRPRT